MENQFKEIVEYLRPDSRFDLKSIAIENVLGLTGVPEGIDCILETSEIVSSIVRLLNDTFAVVAKQAVLCLINISAVERGAEKLLNLDPPFLITDVLAELIFNPASHIADQCCIILSNLTRSAQFVDEIFEHIQKSKHTLENYVDIFTKVNYSTEGASLHYLASFFANLSQSVQVRKYICRKNDSLMHKLLPFITFKDSVIRRSGTVAAVRNCCFDTENHSWLLSSEVDILPYLLLPLAGNEEYSEEDNEKLPLDLQYLPEDKKRESIADIRCMLLEAVTQLCAKRENREFIREKNTYLILRDLHKEETDPKVLAACENLVDLLIRTESEIGEDNLKETVIPDHLVEKFNNLNAQ